MAVEARALYRGGRRYVRPIARLSRTLLRLMGRERAALDVFLVDNAFVRRYRAAAVSHERPDLLQPLHSDGFNVLSFPAAEPRRFPEGPGAHLGEIYLHLPYLRRHGESPLALLIHGLLHLAGYRHRLRRDRMAMERRERALEQQVREHHPFKRDLQLK